MKKNYASPEIEKIVLSDALRTDAILNSGHDPIDTDEFEE